MKIKPFLCVLLCAGLIISLSSCLKNRRVSVAAAPSTTQATTVTTTAPTTTTATKPVTQPKNDDSEYKLDKYSHLSSYKKEVYDRIEQAVKDGEEKLEISGEEMQEQVYDKVFYYALAVDHPEYFYVRPFSEGYSNGSEIVKADFRIKYVYSAEQTAQKQRKIDDIVKKLKASLPENATDYDKALLVYDYIIDNCEYADEYADDTASSQQSPVSTMEGCLLNKRAVCTGYSRAYNYILKKMGLKCTSVSNPEHEWNLLMLAGDYYYTDVTWSDAPQTRYKYFAVTTEQIKKDHKLPDENLPLCTAVKGNDYVKNKKS